MMNTMNICQLKKDKIDSQSHETIRKILLFKITSLKVIDLVLFNVDNHDKDIFAIGYKNKTLKIKIHGIK